MNILFTRFPLESRLGGAELQTLSLMKGLAERGHDVSFLGSCPILLAESGKWKMESTVLDIGNPPVSKWELVRFFWKKNSMKKKLVKALDELSTLHSPFSTIVMLSMTEKLLLTGEALKRGIKVIWLEHDPIGRWLTKNPWLPDLVRLSRDVTTITVSERSRHQYLDLKWYAGDIVAIPNGIDFERFSSSKNEKRVTSNEQLHVGTVARLAEEKGIDLLLEAVRDLPQVNLTIVGEGPEENYVRNFITDVTLKEGLAEPRIKLLKNVDDLGAFYRSLDIFVLPSRNDPFGMVAAEAMSQGIPTIVTYNCGIAKYLDDGEDALIVMAGSANVLGTTILQLSEEKERKRVGNNGKKTAHEKFSVEKMVDKYEEILKN